MKELKWNKELSVLFPNKVPISLTQEDLDDTVDWKDQDVGEITLKKNSELLRLVLRELGFVCPDVDELRLTDEALSRESKLSFQLIFNCIILDDDLFLLCRS